MTDLQELIKNDTDINPVTKNTRPEKPTPTDNNEPQGFAPEKLYKVRLDNENRLKDIIIQHTQFFILLKSFGFMRYDIEKEYFFVRVEDNIIEDVTETQIQDTFFSWLKQLPDTLKDGTPKDIILEKFHRSPENFFSKKKLSLLPRGEFEFCADNKTEAFIFFKNGFVKCTSQGFDLMPYSKLKGCLWKKQILNRAFEKHEDFKKPSFDIDMDKPEKDFLFIQFLYNVSGQDKQRFMALCSITGYALHNHFEGKLKALVLTDSEISDSANGRTGKTLYAKALGMIRRYIEINGKDFNPEDKFKYQDVNHDTIVVHLNDVKKNFDIEKVFNDITEGVSSQKKNQQPIRKQVKMIISTNKTIKIEGASAKDRVIELEFSNHYSDIFSPETEFKKWFFGNGWTEKDWNEFDNFMCYCLCLFIRRGLVQANQINLNRRKLLDLTPEDVIQFMEDKFKDNTYKPDEILWKNDIREAFLNAHPECREDKQWKDVKQLTQWLRNFANYSDHFEKNVPIQDEVSRNSKRIFVFRAKGYRRTQAKEFVEPKTD